MPILLKLLLIGVIAAIALFLFKFLVRIRNLSIIVPILDRHWELFDIGFVILLALVVIALVLLL
ncbi:MAG: hypothetical protein KJI72_00365 [Patescibacteria group bacterium]|nr:hypothetical protein [Patescibacteria group bacterium]